MVSVVAVVVMLSIFAVILLGMVLHTVQDAIELRALKEEKERLRDELEEGPNG